jgi:hypothetical protein
MLLAPNSFEGGAGAEQIDSIGVDGWIRSTLILSGTVMRMIN